MAEQNNYGLEQAEFRRELGRSETRYANELIRDKLPAFEQDITRDVLSGNETIAHAYHEKTPLPCICASYINRRIRKWRGHRCEELTHHDIVNNKEDLRFILDYSFGIELALSPLEKIRMEHEGGGESVKFEDANMRAKKRGFSTGDTAEYYLHLTDKANKLRDRLLKNPTGIALIEHAIEEIKEGSAELKIGKFRNGEYVLAGAEAAKNLYEKLHQKMSSVHTSASQGI